VASFEQIAAKPMPSAAKHAGIRDEPVDHRFDIGAVIANEDDHRAVFARPSASA